eukprot:TRINITY_DN815_c0_g1_i1.p1 TRINITY_DN815_c0_g1~~TRINITY_DN815_c0_g1_i1.p1  ORF type:complete len:400 (-),score=155.76 TRINITY_DN815_c0_g1_i1:488-1687(-)
MSDLDNSRDQFSDDEFGESFDGDKGKFLKVQNENYDEAHELSGDSFGESVDTHDALPIDGIRNDHGDSPPRHNMDLSGNVGEYAHDDSDSEIPGAKDSMTQNHAIGMIDGGDSESESSSEEEVENVNKMKGTYGRQSVMKLEKRDSDDESSSEDDDEVNGVPIEGGYNPSNYAHLDVPAECRDLFQYIPRYKPHTIELETKLKCFTPDLIPAIGEIDPFIKIPRPDGKSDMLALKVLDEPATEQSDPTVTEMQLRALSKKAALEPVVVRSIEDAEKNPREIQKWINSITELHKTKPKPQVHYKKPMPDVEVLMQEWPAEFEEALKDIPVPGANINMELKEYCRVACALLDIPVYDNIVESMHLLFTLYNEFKTNPHFQNLLKGENAANPAVDMSEGLKI